MSTNKCEAIAERFIPGVKDPILINSILKERGKRYGEFKSHAQVTQLLKNVMYGSPKWFDLSWDQKESLEMIAHKIGRILNGDPNYDDSWVDIAGYAKLVSDRLQNVNNT